MHIVHAHWQPKPGGATALPQGQDGRPPLVLAFSPRAWMDDAPRLALQQALAEA